MPRNRSIRVSNNIYMTFSPVWYFSRIFGLAPFSLGSTGSSWWKLKLSVLCEAYSILLGATLATFTIQGMVNELQIREGSYRMKAGASKYVTCADFIIVQVVVILGILKTSVHSHKFFAFIEDITEVDSLFDVTDVQKTRMKTICALTLIMGSTALLLGFDLYSWHTSAKASNMNFAVANYLRYNVSYFVFVLVIFQFAHIVYSIKRRLKLINESLQKLYSNNKDVQTTVHYNKRSETRHNTLVEQIQNLCTGFNRRQKVLDLNKKKYGKPPLALPRNDHVLRLTKAYLTACDAVDDINNVFGLVVLITLLAFLLHFTVTPYFFIVELTGRCDPTFLVLQVVWFLTHFFELILIVEPCSMCLTEVKLINGTISRLLTSDIGDNYRSQLELFFKQLQFRQIEFSVFGMGTINRSLLTSMAGAMTVYLVTIIQLRNSSSI